MTHGRRIRDLPITLDELLRGGSEDVGGRWAGVRARARNDGVADGAEDVRGEGDGVAGLQRGWDALAPNAPQFGQAAAVATGVGAEYVVRGRGRPVVEQGVAGGVAGLDRNVHPQAVQGRQSPAVVSCQGGACGSGWLRPMKNSRNGSMLGSSPASIRPLRRANIWASWMRWVGWRSGRMLGQ
jgi:hypothetical protein